MMDTSSVKDETATANSPRFCLPEHSKKSKKSLAEKQRDYGARINNNPVIYELHRELETDRAKQYRKTCPEDHKARNKSRMWCTS